MRLSLTACGVLVACLALYSCGSDGDQVADGDGGDAGTAGATDGGAGLSSGGSKAQAGEPSSLPVGGAGGSSTEPGNGGAGATPEGGEGGAGGTGGEANTCEIGEVQSAGTEQNLDLFGTVVYFADGAELPAGRYRATYLDGCMKYRGGQDWTVHAYAGGNPCCGWWFVGNSTDDRIVNPPGTVGYTAANGAFATFDECVEANKAVPPLEFDFTGGKLGVWLQDSPYSDNMAGVDGRNPKWQLTLLSECVE
jgi:hypothetical protein